MSRIHKKSVTCGNQVRYDRDKEDEIMGIEDRDYVRGKHPPTCSCSECVASRSWGRNRSLRVLRDKHDAPEPLPDVYEKAKIKRVRNGRKRSFNEYFFITVATLLILASLFGLLRPVLFK